VGLLTDGVAKAIVIENVKKGDRKKGLETGGHF
jgi:hypothetical protein